MDHDTYFYRYGEAHPDDLARWCAEPEPQQPEPEQPEPEPTIEDLRDVIRREFNRANAYFCRALKAEAEVASCRKAFGEIAKSIEDLDLEEIARFAGIPLEHLTGEEAGSDE
jgi:hypothetical protein